MNFLRETFFPTPIKKKPLPEPVEEDNISDLLI